jgi:hypothetical protein
LNVTSLTAVTSSIQYITSSQFNVSTNLIKLNTTTPLRYGGIEVVDFHLTILDIERSI